MSPTTTGMMGGVKHERKDKRPSLQSYSSGSTPSSLPQSYSSDSTNSSVLQDRDGYLFIPEDRVTRYVYYLTIIIALTLAAITTVDAFVSSPSEQFNGDLQVFPKDAYLSLISFFFAFGFLYAFLRWFMTHDTSNSHIPISVQNMNLNLCTFFVTSFLFYIFTLAYSLDNLYYTFSVLFSMQVYCVICLVIFTFINEMLM